MQNIFLAGVMLAFVAVTGCDRERNNGNTVPAGAPGGTPRVAPIPPPASLPVGIARVDAHPIRGVWMTDCVNEDLAINGVTYRSKRIYATLDATRMVRRVFRFGQPNCAVAPVTPIAPDPAEVWTYRIEGAPGVVDGAAWNFVWNDGRREFPGNGRITRAREPGQIDTLQFGGSPTQYRRVVP